jgi:hypothetical protein
VSFGKFVVVATISGDGATVSGAGVTVSMAAGTVPGTGAAVAGAGAVPLCAMSLHPPRQFFIALHELGVVRWLASARERRQRDGLGYTVRTAGRGVKLNIGLNVPG